jgi:DDE superfamily endonuclease
VKHSGTGVQGHSLSPVENARALLHIHEYRQHNLSYNEAVKATAKGELTSPSKLRAVQQVFICNGTLPQPSTSHRGKGNPNHPLHSDNTDEYGPTLKSELLIHELVHTQKTEGISITSTTIAAELRVKLDVCVDRSTVRRWLHALGYHWRHKRYVGGMKPQAKNVRIRQFILEYAEALAADEAGTAIIVYIDESYIHTHHASKKGWFLPSDRDVIGDDDGKRLIILHAMTDSGLLAVPDAVSNNWLNEPALTAELVFEELLEDGQDDSDYHNTMTGVKFVAWLRNRLLSTFAAMYPGKKMYLVLDNASYHKARDETWVSCSASKTKHELAHQLLDLGVEQLTTLDVTPRVIPAHKFGATPSQGGPKKADLIAAVQKWLDEHPNHNHTVVEQVMSDAGHTLIYTPPFCPEVQPIELLWAKVKRYVADRSTHNRSITEAREQTEDGFEKVTKSFCMSIVAHCHDWIDSFLRTDAAEDLQQCGSIAGVIEHLSLLKAVPASTITVASIDTTQPMEICPPPPPAAAVSVTSPARNLHCTKPTMKRPTKRRPI